MIVTVTVNPAMDKTAEIDCLRPHALNRLAGVVSDVGGKGINVSKTIAALGRQSVACGFLAGQTGRSIEQTLGQWPGGGIRPDFLTVPGETRTNLKLVEPGGELTELNEQGPRLSPADLDALAQKLEGYAAPGTLFVLAGSVGPGVPPELYRDLTRRLKQRGAKVFVDADGPLFARALEAVPDIIKPNAFELGQYFGLDHTPEGEELIGLGRTLAARGIGLVCISMGGEGACFVQGERVWHAPALPVTPRSTVGAGDAMVAAIACGVEEDLPLEDCLRLGMAVSAGAVTTRGTRPPDPETVRRLTAQVCLTELPH